MGEAALLGERAPASGRDQREALGGEGAAEQGPSVSFTPRPCAKATLMGNSRKYNPSPYRSTKIAFWGFFLWPLLPCILYFLLDSHPHPWSP